MFKIKDGEDKQPTIVDMKIYFERAVTETPLLAKNTPLGTIEINGEFAHYMEPDTDTLWIGFALGMRCAHRVAV